MKSVLNLMRNPKLAHVLVLSATLPYSKIRKFLFPELTTRGALWPKLATQPPGCPRGPLCLLTLLNKHAMELRGLLD